ncbi:sortase domain-containing protein [Streptomyces sp. 8L]|uniref:sortase domain-containing protein n=1 Tax=Streptomyces sp. 8L TaxID=2877242 RepID=UPI001CD67683|nr:sortase [Streptomyces sp. 8L]MCA1219842.1 sortase [Streptomyces sp. 8L]
MIRSRTLATPLTGVFAAALLAVSATAAAGAPHAPPPGLSAAAPHSPASPAVHTRAVTASLTIPSIGIKGLRIVPYEGTTDDWPGTRIQDRGIAASPHGPHGGAGPGDIGNYLVTGHRLSADGPFREVPSIKTGAKVMITAGRTTYTYTITGTRKTDFRSAHSLTEQRAPVPGHPGEKPTKAMITVSTCATPEDNAVGNFWRDAKDNPQHRIDKIGVLTSRSTTHGPS